MTPFLEGLCQSPEVSGPHQRPGEAPMPLRRSRWLQKFGAVVVPVLAGLAEKWGGGPLEGLGQILG